MLRLLSIVALLAFGVTATTAYSQKATECMTRDEARTLANQFGELISNYSDSLALSVLTPSFTDYSSSVNTLINSCPQGDDAQGKTIPLLAPTFSSRKQFMSGQGQQPPINFDLLDVWHTCEGVITIRWFTNNTAPIPNPLPVVGIIVVKSKRDADGTFKIEKVFSEFNSGAWLQNLDAAGICKSAPISSSSAPEPSANPAGLYSATDEPQTSYSCDETLRPSGWPDWISATMV